MRCFVLSTSLLSSSAFYSACFYSASSRLTASRSAFHDELSHHVSKNPAASIARVERASRAIDARTSTFLATTKLPSCAWCAAIIACTRSNVILDASEFQRSSTSAIVRLIDERAGGAVPVDLESSSALPTDMDLQLLGREPRIQLPFVSRRG